MNKIQMMTKTKKNQIIAQNEGRLKLGFDAIEIKIKCCNNCAQLFETTGNINCGCNLVLRQRTTTLLGTDCI